MVERTNININPDFLKATEPPENSSSLIRTLLHAVAYSAVQSPLHGVTQLAEKTTGYNLPHIQLVDQLKEAPFMSSQWHAQQIGGAVGMTLPYMAVNAVVGRGGDLLSRGLKTAGCDAFLSNSVVKTGTPILRAATAGALYEGLLHPTGETEGGGNFLTAKRNQVIAGFTTFGLLEANIQGLKAISTIRNAQTPWLVNTAGRQLIRHMAAGGIAGVADAEVRSILEGNGNARVEDMGKAAYGFMFVGASMHGVRCASDKFFMTERIGSTITKETATDISVRKKDQGSVVQKPDTERAQLASIYAIGVGRCWSPREIPTEFFYEPGHHHGVPRGAEAAVDACQRGGVYFDHPTFALQALSIRQKSGPTKNTLVVGPGADPILAAVILSAENPKQFTALVDVMDERRFYCDKPSGIAQAQLSPPEARLYAIARCRNVTPSDPLAKSLREPNWNLIGDYIAGSLQWSDSAQQAKLKAVEAEIVEKYRSRPANGISNPPEHPTRLLAQ